MPNARAYGPLLHVQLPHTHTPTHNENIHYQTIYTHMNTYAHMHAVPANAIRTYMHTCTRTHAYTHLKHTTRIPAHASMHTCKHCIHIASTHATLNELHYNTLHYVAPHCMWHAGLHGTKLHYILLPCVALNDSAVHTLHANITCKTLHSCTHTLVRSGREEREGSGERGKGCMTGNWTGQGWFQAQVGLRLRIK